MQDENPDRDDERDLADAEAQAYVLADVLRRLRDVEVRQQIGSSSVTDDADPDAPTLGDIVDQATDATSSIAALEASLEEARLAVQQNGEDVRIAAEAGQAAGEAGTAAAELANEAADAANAAAEQANENADRAQQRAEAAVAAAADAVDDAVQARKDAAAAVDAASGAHDLADQARQDATNALDRAQQASDAADGAVSDAATATDKAQQASDAAAGARQDAANAVAAAGTAGDKAQQAYDQATTATGAAADALTAAAGKSKVLVQPSAPTGANADPLNTWVDTSVGADGTPRFRPNVYTPFTVPDPNTVAVILPAASAQTETEVMRTSVAPNALTPVVLTLSVSMSLNGVAKSSIARLRDGATGAVLASYVFSDKGDSTGGNAETWTLPAAFTAKPTASVLVVTIQSNNASNPTVYSLHRTITASKWQPATDAIATAAAASAATALANAATADGKAVAAQTTANTRTRVLAGPGAPTENGSAVGDLWFTIPNTTTGIITGQYRWDGSAWKQQTVDSAVLASVDAGKITSGYIAAARIQAGTITASMIAGDTITAAQIAANAITASELAAGAVTAGKIAAGTIVAGDIAAGTITGDRIAADTLTATQIAAGAIGVGELAAGAVTADKIQAASITGDRIAARTITVDKVAITDTTNLWPNQYLTLPAPFIDAATVGTLTPPVGKTARLAARDHIGWMGSEFAVRPGQIHVVDFTAKRVQGTLPIAGGVWVRDINRATQPFSYQYANATKIADLTDGWARYRVIMPVGMIGSNLDVTPAWGYLYFQLEQGGSEDYRTRTEWEVADITIRRQGGGELIVDGAITTDKIVAAAITGAKIAADTITAANIAAGAVQADEIAANAITSDKIAANAITAAHISAGAIQTDDLAANAVTAAKIAAATITAAQIAAGTISTDLLAAGAVTAAKIAANTITAAQIAAGTITGDLIAANTITAADIAAATITGAEIAAATITTSNLAADSVTAAKIAADAILARNIKAGEIQAGHIAAAAIDASKIQAGAVIAEKIGAGEVTATKLAAGAVTANSVAAGAIDGITVTGATIRSAATGKRVELGSNLLRFYDANNMLAGRIDGVANGAAGGLVSISPDGNSLNGIQVGTFALPSAGSVNMRAQSAWVTDLTVDRMLNSATGEPFQGTYVGTRTQTIGNGALNGIGAFSQQSGSSSSFLTMGGDGRFTLQAGAYIITVTMRLTGGKATGRTFIEYVDQDDTTTRNPRASMAPNVSEDTASVTGSTTVTGPRTFRAQCYQTSSGSQAVQFSLAVTRVG